MNDGTKDTEKAAGPTRLHALALLKMIAEIEKRAIDALSDGYAPHLDAFETTALLRALITGADKYEIDMTGIRKRFDLAKRSGHSVISSAFDWDMDRARDERGAP